MTVEERIEAFAKLGEFLSQFQPDGIVNNQQVALNDTFFEPFNLQISRAAEYNGWFTKDNVLTAFSRWGKILNKSNLTNWTSSYNLDTIEPKMIGVVMAGNIPLVGFHDFLTVLISGHSIKVKQSSADNKFLPLIAKYLEYVAPDFKGKIHFTDEKLENIDAVIATGSNNTARYFDYYFGKFPNIIRRNRNSAAILTGKESEDELINLGEDIFRYFGLGCRSVSKLFVPEGYDFDPLFSALYRYKDVLNYDKYVNNYDYNKAVYLMSNFKLLENGFLMLKEDKSYSSPIATVFYEYYSNDSELEQKLSDDKELIQCLVGSSEKSGMVSFGQTQKPGLSDYADGIDTLSFLEGL
ncbi:acyl-CoA reductase [Lutimonas saemankumensis]|uniref:acyl-CoA reductase n=1 Tax=Lutimonas saemankumensis TaxID=483016 RepID=UPI001CD3C5AE|nr:acyl-CoA reductase [Lutimonas saemankumensis]MCA0931704.1 acyl-CoA reductase [Lutimonas saemankumensis]